MGNKTTAKWLAQEASGGLTRDELPSNQQLERSQGPSGASWSRVPGGRLRSGCHRAPPGGTGTSPGLRKIGSLLFAGLRITKSVRPAVQHMPESSKALAAAFVQSHGTPQQASPCCAVSMYSYCCGRCSRKEVTAAKQAAFSRRSGAKGCILVRDWVPVPARTDP